jgi:hypothetical protein
MKLIHRVAVTRTVTQIAVFEVLAESPGEAHAVACDRAAEHLWSSGAPADYSPDIVDFTPPPGEPFESVDDAGFASKRCWLLPNGKYVYRNTWNNTVSVPDPGYIDTHTRDFDTLEEGLLWWADENKRREEKQRKEARRKK